ncbi:hypothetical protein BCF11_3533 [Collimonas sp. PA-H2]|uniref:hypothetical protein n=1 Tax=Collimonas sp. PA-H2 TaxID=1881062 RepID=UPI000BF84BA3|nr:hypothetical protein [Collimonas sp. PA-H2]PFH11092.1 hypothetical protein BCF11_3533 [Collimonas sp. PA-H2]
MKIVVVAVFLLLTGCASNIVGYRPTAINPEQARSVIEQVLMEQPSKNRPEQVFFTEEYVGYGNGVISTSKGFASATSLGNGAISVGSSVTSSKAQQTRIYFNSIESVTLYSQRNRWVVLTRNQAGSILNKSLVDTQNKAEKFVDALMYFKEK